MDSFENHRLVNVYSILRYKSKFDSCSSEFFQTSIFFAMNHAVAASLYPYSIFYQIKVDKYKKEKMNLFWSG